jgi:hypothetical protein
MMLPPPITRRFVLEGHPYCLVEWTRGGWRRIRTEQALAYAVVPGILEALDGANLFAEAVARECLKEAPALWWDEQPAGMQNGTPRRVITFERIPHALWDAFYQEVDAFVAEVFRRPAAPSDAAPPAVPAEPTHLAPAETVPAVFRGRAE